MDDMAAFAVVVIMTFEFQIRTAAFCYYCLEAPMWMYSVGKQKEICANGPLVSVCKMLVEAKAALLPLFLASEGLDSSICLGRISHVDLLPPIVSLGTSENHLVLNLLNLSGRQSAVWCHLILLLLKMNKASG